MASVQMSLGETFSRQLSELAKLLRNHTRDTEQKLTTAFRKIGVRWRSEAVKRVPVDEGTLKQRIVSNTYKADGELITEVGSNVAYAPFLEFGTRYIAAGNVLRLGLDPEVTDAQAIKIWPAKNSGITNADGSLNRAGRHMQQRAASGGAQEQMPWLRPAFMSIRTWAIQQLHEAVRWPLP